MVKNNGETKGFLSGVTGDQKAGLGGLPTTPEDGAPEGNKYLFQADGVELKYSKSEKNLGVSFLMGEAIVLEPDEFEGMRTRFMLWLPGDVDEDAGGAAKRNNESGMKKFKGVVETVLGDDAFDGLPDDRDEALSTLAEMFDGARFVGQMKMGKAKGGYEARPELGDVFSDTEWAD